MIATPERANHARLIVTPRRPPGCEEAAEVGGEPAVVERRLSADAVEIDDRHAAVAGIAHEVVELEIAVAQPEPV